MRLPFPIEKLDQLMENFDDIIHDENEEHFENLDGNFTENIDNEVSQNQENVEDLATIENNLVNI